MKYIILAPPGGYTEEDKVIIRAIASTAKGCLNVMIMREALENLKTPVGLN